MAELAPLRAARSQPPRQPPRRRVAAAAKDKNGKKRGGKKWVDEVRGRPRCRRAAAPTHGCNVAPLAVVEGRMRKGVLCT